MALAWTDTQRTALRGPEAGSAAAVQAATVVLGYHRVVPRIGADPFALCVTSRTFEQHVLQLAAAFRIVDFDEFVGTAKGDPTDPRPRVLLTFDDGYRDVYEHAYPILWKHRIPAVLFVSTGYIGYGRPFWWELLAAYGEAHGVGPLEMDALQRRFKSLAPGVRAAEEEKLAATLPLETGERLAEIAMTWDMCAELDREGLVRVAPHTRWHPSLGALAEPDVRAEIDGCFDDFAAHLGRPAALFAYPHGAVEDIGPFAPQLLASRGVQFALTTVPGVIAPGYRAAAGSPEAMLLSRFIVSEMEAEFLVGQVKEKIAEAGFAAPPAPVPPAPVPPMPAPAPRGEAAPAPRFETTPVAVVDAPAAPVPAVRRRITVLSGISAANLGDDAMLIATVQGLLAVDAHADVTVLAETPETCDPVARAIGVPVLRSLQQLVAAVINHDACKTDPARAVRALAAQIVQDRDALLAGAVPQWLPEEFAPGLVALLGADAVVDCGGANLSTIWKSFFYEKCLDYLVAPRPLLVSGQGIDEFADPADRALLKDALSCASRVTVRETFSRKALERLGLHVPHEVTGDDAIDLAPAPAERCAEIARAAGLPDGAPYLAFQYRHYLDYGEAASFERFARLVDAAIAVSGLPVLGVPMHFTNTDEREHLLEVARHVRQRERFLVVREQLDAAEAKGLVAGATAAFGISYHSAVFALSSAVPYLGLFRGAHYSQKMLGLSELFEDHGLAVPLDDATPERFAELLHARLVLRDSISEHLREVTLRLTARVRGARQALVDAIVPQPVAPGPEALAPAAPIPVVAPAAPAPLIVASGAPVPVGQVNWGDLRRTAPISADWGFDRGKPVDRVYIEAFMTRHASDVCGRVCEMANRDYTLYFGGGRVTRSDVLDIDAKNPLATVIADLTAPGGLPENVFDCFILTQTISYIYDCGAALANAYGSLAAGGVLLVTVPSIIKYHREPEDHWRFTPESLARLVAERCPGARAEVQGYGNLVVATAFLQGIAAQELGPEELEFNDPAYPIVVSARIVKGAR